MEFISEDSERFGVPMFESFSHQGSIGVAVFCGIRHGKAKDECFVLIEQTASEQDVDHVVSAKSHCAWECNWTAGVFESSDDFRDLNVACSGQRSDQIVEWNLVVVQAGVPVAPVFRSRI